MPKYRSHGQLDDPFVEDGDRMFLGLDANTEPSLLESGMVKLSVNMRFDSGVAKVRKGLNQIIQLAEPCLALLPFSDPDGNNDILALGSDHAYFVITNKSPLAFAETMTEPFGLQVFNKILVFENGKRPQESGGEDDFTQFSSTPSIDDGLFVACPNAPFGIYMSNRLIVPDYSDTSTTVIASDLLQENLFQLSTGEFYLNYGTNDRILAFSVFAENQLLAFNQNSIFLINNIHSLDSAQFEITRQYGIAGTKALCQNGSYTYFMSSEGNIQVLVPSSDPAKGLGISISKTTLDQEPLSKPITPILENIDFNYLWKTIIVYHRNRVYCAFVTQGQTDARTIVVYNSLNSVWESLDILPVPINDMVSHRGRLYIASGNNIYEYESAITDDGAGIVGQLETRDYTLGSLDIKKFIRGSIGYASANGGNTSISVFLKDPDGVILSKSIQEDDDDFDRMTRFSTRRRGYAASVQVSSVSGGNQQNEIRRISMEGFVGNGRTGGTFDGN